MEIHARLRQLEFQYLAAASAARAAKAIYCTPSRNDDPTPGAAQAAKALLGMLLNHKREISAIMRDIEESDGVG